MQIGCAKQAALQAVGHGLIQLCTFELALKLQQPAHLVLGVAGLVNQDACNETLGQFCAAKFAQHLHAQFRQLLVAEILILS